MGVAEVTRARDRLLTCDVREATSTEVCAAIARAIHELAPFGWCAVMTTDPDTLLPSGGVVEGFEPDDCAPFWDNELLDPDFNKFTDMGRRGDGVASLVEAVDGDLGRSPRYQKLYAGLGAADELRVVFRAGSTCLAVAAFIRTGEQGPLTPHELADVQALLPVAVKVLRRALGRVHADSVRTPPVVILLDHNGSVTGMTEGGQAVLEDLRIEGVDEELPGLVLVAARKARWSRTSSELTTRLRGRSGRWHRLHVAPMAGEVGAVAVTVEVAQPDDLAQILLDSYGLTDRETEIALWLCRGLSAKDIAAEMMISPHTVRDHVKVVYEKAGVTSRGELVAGLFSNHVLDRFHEAVEHID